LYAGVPIISVKRDLIWDENKIDDLFHDLKIGLIVKTSLTWGGYCIGGILILICLIVIVHFYTVKKNKDNTLS